MTAHTQWRAMTGLDLAAVDAVAARVHPGFFESSAVLAEKHRLYPHGAHILELAERPVGYVLSHPWISGDLPALDRLLGAIPADADSFYIHDLALLPLARRIGAAGAIVETLAKHARARGFAEMSLVAVNNSQPFWQRQGFAVVEAPHLADKLAGYEAAARYMRRML